MTLARYRLPESEQDPCTRILYAPNNTTKYSFEPKVIKPRLMPSYTKMMKDNSVTLWNFFDNHVIPRTPSATSELFINEDNNVGLRVAGCRV